MLRIYWGTGDMISKDDSTENTRDAACKHVGASQEYVTSNVNTSIGGTSMYDQRSFVHNEHSSTRPELKETVDANNNNTVN